MPEPRDGVRRARVTEPGPRLDAVLALVFPGLGRRGARAAISEGRVFVDGRRCRVASRPVGAGARLVLHPLRSSPLPTPALPILHEDDAWIVLDKPAGWAVNVSETSARSAVVEPFADRDARVVHRLDRDTTGVMVLAKGPVAAAALSRAFAERRVEKVYWAVVEGEGLEGILDGPIGPDRRRPRARAVVSGGQVAETEVSVRARGHGVALIEARPRTGRTHQIRVHLSHAGAPIVGDALYGGPVAIALDERVVRVGRPLLHALRLVLPHPEGPRAFTAPLPPDIAAVARTLGVEPSG